MPPTGSLTNEQLRFFDTNGYLVLESFSSAEEVKAMRVRMAELVDGFDGAGGVFSTKDHRQVKNDFFFKSAENIAFFFEEKAFGDDGCLKQAKELSINKVGHALHELDPVFKKFAFGANVSSLFSSLCYKRPAVIQSMYIFKQPGIGGEVVPHQDNTFLYTEPPSCTGLWLALEDATKRMVAFGQFLDHIKVDFPPNYFTSRILWLSELLIFYHLQCFASDGLKRRMIRDENDTHFDHPSPTYDLKEFVPLEVKSGDLVVIHGDLIHQSFENLSLVSRHALSLHVIDTEGCEWSKKNWLQRKNPPQPLYEN